MLPQFIRVLQNSAKPGITKRLNLLNKLNYGLDLY